MEPVPASWEAGILILAHAALPRHRTLTEKFLANTTYREKVIKAAVGGQVEKYLKATTKDLAKIMDICLRANVHMKKADEVGTWAHKMATKVATVSRSVPPVAEAPEAEAEAEAEAKAPKAPTTSPEAEAAADGKSQHELLKAAFNAVDEDGSYASEGTWTYDEFLTVCGGENNDDLILLYSLIDRDASGEIDLRELTQTLQKNPKAKAIAMEYEAMRALVAHVEAAERAGAVDAPAGIVATAIDGEKARNAPKLTRPLSKMVHKIFTILNNAPHDFRWKGLFGHEQTVAYFTELQDGIRAYLQLLQAFVMDGEVDWEALPPVPDTRKATVSVEEARREAAWKRKNQGKGDAEIPDTPKVERPMPIWTKMWDPITEKHYYHNNMNGDLEWGPEEPYGYEEPPRTSPMKVMLEPKAKGALAIQMLWRSKQARFQTRKYLLQVRRHKKGVWQLEKEGRDAEGHDAALPFSGSTGMLRRMYSPDKLQRARERREKQREKQARKEWLFLTAPDLHHQIVDDGWDRKKLLKTVIAKDVGGWIVQTEKFREFDPTVDRHKVTGADALCWLLKGGGTVKKSAEDRWWRWVASPIVGEEEAVPETPTKDDGKQAAGGGSSSGGAGDGGDARGEAGAPGGSGPASPAAAAEPEKLDDLPEEERKEVLKERREKAAADRAAAKDAKAVRAQELAAKREANLAKRAQQKQERIAAALREHEQTHVGPGGPGGEKGWTLKYDAKDRYPYWEHKETKESKWCEDDEVAAINAMVDALKAQG